MVLDLFNILAEGEEAVEETSTKIDWQSVINNISDWCTTSGIRLVIGLVVLFISFKIVNFFGKRILKRCAKKNVDKTISKTLVYVGKIVIKIAIAVGIIGYIGIDTSGLTALVASLGVCIGLAVNGAVGNIAGGVLILITRPFRIDDYISVAGYEGTVEDIHMVNTKLRTVDNKVIYVPNGVASSSTVTNFSEKSERRVDLTFAISYGEDFKKAKDIILDICNSHQHILKDPAPFVRVSEHGDKALKIVCRSWVKSEDYWDVYHDLLEFIKQAFVDNNIALPHEQVDVHMK